MDADGGRRAGVADVVHVVLAEDDGVAGLALVGAERAGTGHPDQLVERPLDHGEDAARPAVVVQLGALVLGPADEPHVEVVVGVQAHVPALVGVGADGVASLADLRRDDLGPLDEVGEREAVRSWVPGAHDPMQAVPRPSWSGVHGADGVPRPAAVR